MVQFLLTFDQFAEVFHDNVFKRSRTAKGQFTIGIQGAAHTEMAAKKKKLLLTGDALKRQVAVNTGKLIYAVWNARTDVLPSPARLRELSERWFDIINDRLQDAEAYAAEQKKLEQDAKAFHQESGLAVRINPRYRLWTPEYTVRHIAPVALEYAMDEFYRDLSRLIGQAQTDRVSQAALLAMADYTIDQEIHPWLDSCGRSATAMVMWLSIILPDGRLPVFADRKEHYAALGGGIEIATRYYAKCLGLA